jgi:hypothetical protein
MLKERAAHVTRVAWTEERAGTAIVLDHEQPDQKSRGWQREHQAQPVANAESCLSSLPTVTRTKTSAADPIYIFNMRIAPVQRTS